ncbi:MAG TPA: COX15/CtaA family protein [Limnochordales bacterium]
MQARRGAALASSVPVGLAQAVAVFSLLVVVVGGVVRVTGSGLGCPDWPLCYGSVVPPVGGAALVEFSHRVVAGLFMLGVYWLAWRTRAGRAGAPAAGSPGAARIALSRLTAATAVLVTIQALLGGANVLTELAPSVGGAHLILATVVVGLTAAAVVLARATAREGSGRVPVARASVSRALAATAAVLAMAVVGIGAYVRALGASLACTDWPLCGGSVLPPSGWPFWLQWSHRVAALALGMAIVAGTLRSRGAAAWWSAGLLYVIQVGLGAVAVVWQLPAAVRVAHLGVATLLVALLSAEAARCWLAEDHRAQLGAVRASRAHPGLASGA